MTKIISTVLLFIATICMTGCGKDGDVVLLPTATLTIDGVTKGLIIGTAILGFVDELGHEGRALTISFSVSGSPFSVAVANWDFQAPPDNGIKVKSYSSVLGADGGGECLALSDGITELCESAALTYIVGNQYYTSIYYDGTYVGSVKIAACDVSKKVVSGEFDMKVADVAGDTLAMKGTFTNVKYIVNK